MYTASRMWRVNPKIDVSLICPRETAECVGDQERAEAESRDNEGQPSTIT